MMGYLGLSTRSKKWVKTKMKTTINFYGKDNEVVFSCTLFV